MNYHGMITAKGTTTNAFTGVWVSIGVVGEVLKRGYRRKADAEIQYLSENNIDPTQRFLLEPASPPKLVLVLPATTTFQPGQKCRTH